MQVHKKGALGPYMAGMKSGDSRVIHVLAVEAHDVVEHAFGFHGRTVGVELRGLYVAVDGLMPLPLLAPRIALFIKLPGGSYLLIHHALLWLH